MAIPRIDIHDGKHKLIVAEDGERVLTPAQNKTYEASHPDARKEPMKAQLYDLGGTISGIKDEFKHQTPLQKQAAVAAMPGQEVVNTSTSPQMNQLYDKGGNVGMPSITDRIKSRAKDILAQGQQAKGEMDENAEALRAKNENINSVKAQGEAQNAPASTQMRPYAPVASDKINPSAEYGSRPGEQRLDPQGNVVQPTTPAGLGAIGPQRPVPTALGKAYDCGGMVYDEGGDVSIDHESSDPAKEAAYHQAASEVHAEEAEKAKGAPADFGGPVIPNPKGIEVKGDTDQEKPDYKLQGAKMETENAPLKKAPMNTANPPSFDSGNSMEREASTHPLGKINAPQSTQMKNLPGIEAPLGNGTTDVPYTPAAGEASAEAAGYPVQHKEGAPAEPDIMSIIQKDKIDAAKRGQAGLADLGLAKIHENVFSKKEAPTPLGPNLGPVNEELPAPTKGENPEAAKRDFEMKQLHEKMLYAPTEQERFQAEKDLAELKRRTPWGTAENHPGILGKIGHVASQIGQAALRPIAPYVADYIPGSKAQLNEQAARGEQGVEQAQEKELKGAQIETAKLQPEVAEAKAEQAEQKIQNAENALLRKQQLKVDAAGNQIPLTYEELSPTEQGAYDLQEAKSSAQNSIAALKQAQADPDSPQSKLIIAKAKAEGEKMDLAGKKLGLDVDKYKADYLGVDHENNPLAGVDTDEKGNPVGVKVGKGNTATSMRLNKADLSQNVQLNTKNAIDMITANPELFGKVAGRFTNVRQMAGSGDDAIKKLSIEVHNIAVASAGIHGQRGQAAVEAYENDILNRFHDSPEATIAGLNELSGSVQTFIDDAKAGKKVAPNPTAPPANKPGETTSAYAEWDKKNKPKPQATPAK
jgi:hypothetical protein